MFTETTIGSMNYNVLRNLLKQGNVLKLKRGAEIGVLYGDTSYYLLSEFPSLKLHCVDPYLEYDEHAYDRTQKAMDQYEQIARDRLAEFGDRAIMMKLTSIEAARLVEPGSLDFVFIGANHEYEAVMEDLAAWSPKVRIDGLICGHDYRWDGVQKAVHEWTAKLGVPGYCTPISSDIWFFAKPA